MPGPLAGVRVLELARILAGPWAGQVLADLGADVIKVERSKTGDDTRAWGPPFIEGKDGSLGAAYFHSTNRGKRSIECDFETDDGKRIVRKLAAKSDISLGVLEVAVGCAAQLVGGAMLMDHPRHLVGMAREVGGKARGDQEINWLAVTRREIEEAPRGGLREQVLFRL